jgi:hypothetical protein
MKFCLLEERKKKTKPTEEEKYIDLLISNKIGYMTGPNTGYALNNYKEKYPELYKEINKWWKKEGKIKYAKEIKKADKFRKEYEKEYSELTTEEIKTLREMIKEYKLKKK